MKKSLVAMGVVAVLALLTAVAIYYMTTSNLFRDYDIMSGEWSAGPSPAIALIPLAVAVIAGVGALTFWLVGVSENRQSRTGR